MDDTNLTLGEATAEQMANELSRRGLAHMLAVETAEPGASGKLQVQIFIKACTHKADGMLRELEKLVLGM